MSRESWQTTGELETHGEGACAWSLLEGCSCTGTGEPDAKKGGSQLCRLGLMWSLGLQACTWERSRYARRRKAGLGVGERRQVSRLAAVDSLGLCWVYRCAEEWAC